MLFHIILKNLQSNILSLRLYIALIMTIVVFSFGSIAFVKSHSDSVEEYKKYENDYIENMRTTAEENLTNLAIGRRSYLLKPRDNSFITDAKENYIPGRYHFSAYNVFGFDVKPGGTNPYLNVTNDLNWAYIISVIISFLVFVFTFDSISGEKELKTLALSFSNSLSRGTYLFGTYLSSIIISILVLVPGICVSLMILLSSGKFSLTPEVLFETVCFIVVTGIFVACIAAFGILSSVITRSSRVSLLLALAFWLMFAVAIPNTALFWANTLFTVDRTEAISERVSRALDDIEKNGLPGRWSSSGGNPFLPQHELRADNQTNRMNAEKRIRDAYYISMFNQLEKVRLFTLLSPISVFEYLNEAVVGGGYLRFKTAWEDIHEYQARFLAFFKEKDSLDEDSPHWFNPFENYSTTKKPVNFEEVPVFRETSISLGERFTFAGKYLLWMMVYTVVIFFATFVLFVRYDVR